MASPLFAVMTDGDVTSVAGRAIWVTLQIGGPILIVGLLVGLVVSVFQAVTQIQEQTLVFVPKIVAVFIVLLLALPFAGAAMSNLMTDIAGRIAAY